jgi:hypothetical protein
MRPREIGRTRRQLAASVAPAAGLDRGANAVNQQSRDCKGADGEYSDQHPLLHSRGSAGLRFVRGALWDFLESDGHGGVPK